MSAVLKLVQGSTEWLAYRQSMRNASESAAVLGASPWVTPYQLWMIKTGRATTKVNVAMQHGTDLEPEARRQYEAKTGNVMQPHVLQDGAYSASLDGMTFDGSLILEVKCPYKGQASALWQDVSVGSVPFYYALQIQHQLMVSGAEIAHLWVFDGTDGLLYPIERDAACMETICKAWDGFQQYLDTDTPPPLTESDTVIRADAIWSDAAATYLAAKQDAAAADARLDAAKAELVALCQHPRETGAGVSVTRYWKAGNIDYKRVPELQGMDLDRYRGKGREEIRVTVTA